MNKKIFWKVRPLHGPMRPYAALLAAIMILSGLSACTEEDNPVQQQTKATLFVATDRHEAGGGNNLTAMLQRAVDASGVRPGTVLLGGDYVGGKGDMTPVFSINDLYSEIYAVVDPLSTRVRMTYGSHDDACSEGYGAFYSGPLRCDGYYTYGISYAQMVFDTDSTIQAALLYYQEHGDEKPGLPPGGEGEHGGDGEDGERPPKPEGGVPKQLGYNGIDQADRYGISAESATRHFTEWVSTLADHDPIVVMTHVPMHANRGDNPGGIVWYEALSQAAKHHDIIVLWGHNHTLEERGNDKDQYAYLLTNGDSLSVQGDSLVGVVRKPLNFTYANAGYLKLGHCSVITFSGNNGIYQQMEIRRYSLDPADNEKEFGLTGKPNPYIIQLRRK